ncbi:MAG: hypothetical protein IT288_16915 [Bdellovibrionales bacterium]|nr:hypothetical protein [Bdellovibrionales bacterium]
MKGIFLSVCLSVGSLGAWGQASQFKRISDQEVLSYMFEKAVRLSGLPAYPIDEMPPIYQVSKSDLNRIVCPQDPENCRNLAAVFDDIEYRILVLNDLLITSNFRPFDYSFVIHEIIHSLQYRARGAEIFNGCDAVYETERQAYTAQDRYLKEEGEFFRASITLRFFYCDEEAAQGDYRKSKAVWEARQATCQWPRP